MAPIQIEVTSSSGLYPVVIGADLLGSLGQLLDQHKLGPRRVIVASTIAWNLHHAAFRKLATRADAILVPDGERFKTVSTVGRVYEALLQREADRSVVVIAIGGGVVGDLVGFAAATYLRGVRLVHIPTTLLAQVDSSVGGKVGVNHTLGKNLIGAFHPPKLVVADVRVLSTLPRREFRAGLYEVIKYGVIASESLLDLVGSSLPALFDREPNVLSTVVAESCRIKADVVAADERESGRRRVLNFGHTVGHALEAVTRYRRYRHGEAVAYGMLAALALGVNRGVTPPAAHQRVAELIAKLGPLPPIGDLSAREIVGAVARDKKVVNGTLHFVAASQIGGTTELTDVSEKELKAALHAVGVKG